MAFKVADAVHETTATTGAATSVTLAGAAANSQTFSTKLATGDTCNIALKSGSTVWCVIEGATYNSTANTLTWTAAQVLDGSSGAGTLVTLAGTSDVFMTGFAERVLQQAPDLGVPIKDTATVPATPATGLVTAFMRKLARPILAQIDEYGVERGVELSHSDGNDRAWFIPQGAGGSTTATAGFSAYTAGTTAARNVATTNALSMKRRFGWVSAATAGSAARLADYLPWYIGSSSNPTGGGFFFSTTFGCSDAAVVSGAQAFCGLTNTYNAGTGNPNMTNSFGIGQIATDATQWYLLYGGSTAQAPVALGTALGAPNDTTVPYRLTLWSPKGQANPTIFYEVKNLGTGVSVTGSVVDTGAGGVVLPSNTTSLEMYNFRNNNATAASVSLDVCNFYCESDY